MVSTSVPHAHIGLIISLKHCLNLWSLRLLNCSLRRAWRKYLKDFVLVGTDFLIKLDDDLNR